jgi:hypothetical protein
MSNKQSVELRLTRTVENIFNPWELSDFISEFSNQYYKLDLLRSISIELQNGVSPKNIIILNNSIRRKYFKYGTVDLLNKTHFNSFQSIGFPVSMYPNKKIKQISLISRFFKKSNEILRSNLPPETLSDSYRKIKDNDFPKILDELLEKAIEKLNKGNNTIRQKEALTTLRNNLQNEYDEFIKHEKSIEDYITKLSNNEDVSLGEYEKYFNEFFFHFKRVRKPLVGIYIESENKIKVLCSNHLRNKKKGRPEIDFKRIEHNSPTIFDVVLGAFGVGKSIYEAAQLKKVTEEQIKTEKEKQKSEQLAQELMREQILTEKEKREFFKEQRKKMQQDRKREDDGSTTVKEEIKNIPHNYIREKAFLAYHQQSISANSFMKKYNIKITNIDKSKFNQKV